MESDSPVVSLTTDLIAASKGAPVTTRDGLLLTSFHAVLPAVSTARRLQWAIQGLSEGRDLRGASIAVLIHYAHDLPVQTGETAVRDALAQATPGQILLTESIGKAFDDLPGFPSKLLEKSGLRELLWRAPENQSTRSFDEQVLTQLLEQQGLQDDLPEEPERIVVPVEEEAVDSGPRAQLPAFLALAKSPLGIGIASAVVLLVAAWFIFHSTQAKPNTTESTPAATGATAPANNPSQGTATGQTPVNNTKTPSTAAAAVSAQPTLSAAEKRKQERLEKEQEKKAKLDQAKTVVPPPPPPKPVEDKTEKQGGRGCDLEPGEYGKELERAQNNYAHGHYDVAFRQFGEVVKCEPGNAQARDGLEKSRSEMRKDN